MTGTKEEKKEEEAARPRILIVEDDAVAAEAMAAIVEAEGFAAETASKVSEARTKLENRLPDLMLVDLSLPDGTGLDLLGKDVTPGSCAAIVITGDSDVETAVEAMQNGASDYMIKPLDTARLRTALRDFHKVWKLAERAEEADEGGGIIGESAPIQRVHELIRRVAPTEAPVLLVGESGTGKELVARAIHQQNQRGSKPFVAVNCGAIPPQLTESQLFGHKKGSFTGATADHSGFFEQADGGTLFLDEITEMPLDAQVKLLRTLETSHVTRVGDTTEREVDVRILAATNRDPHRAVTDDRLREDLLFRLNVFPIDLPPLRDRGDDVLLIAREILRSLNADAEVAKGLTDEACEKLRAHSWPGNVRELRNVILRAFILADQNIGPEHLVGLVESHRRPVPDDPDVIRIRVGSTVAEAEKMLILATLEKVGRSKREAARILGISVKTLYNRLKEYAVSDDDNDEGEDDAED